MIAKLRAPTTIGRMAACSILLAVALPAPASAQSNARIERIESEIRALQRAVFPGGDDRFFEPEITPQRAQQGQATTPQAATSAMTDVLARLDSIEQQLSRLTAATEVNENALATLERRVIQLEAGGIPGNPGNTGASQAAAGQGATGQTATGRASTGVIPVPGNNDRVEIATGNAPAPAPAAGPSDARVAAVQAIAKPATGDAGDDEYVYGFRLWDAGFYPEAQQQLSLYLDQYRDHWRRSYGRNLLGRAFLDAGDPRAAATHFLENYNSDPGGVRAPHSLLYLAESMIALGDTRRACTALAVFGDEYPALAAGELLGQYDGLRGRVDCN